MKPLLPEPIEPAGGDIAEIECCRSQPAYRPGARYERPKQTDDFVGRLMHIVRKTGAQQGVNEVGASRHCERGTIETGPTAPLRHEQLLPAWVEHDTQLDLAIDLQRQRATEDGQTVCIVHGPVDRVEHPAIA